MEPKPYVSPQHCNGKNKLTSQHLQLGAGAIFTNMVTRERKTVDITVLKEHPKNPNHHNQDQIDSLAKSMEKYGQYYPIITDENYVILCGHGKKAAIEKRGETQAEVVVMTGLTEKEKLKLLLEDNKIQQMSFVNFEEVEDVLREINETEVIGFSEDYLKTLLEEDYSIDNMGVDLSQQVAFQPAPLPPSAPADSDAPAIQATPEQKAVERKQEVFNEFANGGTTARTITCPHCGKPITL